MLREQVLTDLSFSDLKKMEKLKRQFDDSMAFLNRAKIFLLPLEQTQRVQEGLALGKSETPSQIFLTKFSVGKMDGRLTSAASALHRGRRIAEKKLMELKLSITELSRVFLMINV